MRKKHLILSAFLFTTLWLESTISIAQFQGKVYEPFYDATVKNNGQDLLAPFCGGINSVQVNHVDINNDSKKDLVLYDQNTNSVKTFINIGNAGDIKYKYEPTFEKNFDSLSNYLILKDFNCDGIADLFHKGTYGVSVRKGYFQNNELKFTWFRDLFYPGTFGPVNVYVQPGDIPSIVDIDGDGDLDILSFEVLGAKVTFYKNLRVEDALPCDSLRFINADDCWGKFYQNLYKSCILNISCKGITNQKKNRHSGNCILHIDMDGDGDKDMLGGSISYNDIQYLRNGGSSSFAQIDYQDTTWDVNHHVLDLSKWPSLFNTDIDNDGKLDLIVTPHLDNAETANYNCVAFYKNTGTNTNPIFTWQHDSLLTPEMIDVGMYSFPTVFDYDKDGKPDLFVGTEGYYNNITHTQQSKLAYYRNISTTGNTAFELITKDFLNLSNKNYHGIFPTFGDITGDGIDDLVIGHVNSAISLFQNFSPSNTVQANFIPITDSIPNVYTTSYGAPCIFDFNKDGKNDLLIGNKEGRIYYYEDTSSNTTKKLFLKTISLWNVKAGASNQFYGYCVPTITKMDNTQKKYLVIGNVDGNIARYDSLENNFQTAVRKDSNYSLIKTQARSAPCIADFDNDGKYEMIIGNRLGGLTYYKQLLNVTDTTVQVNNITLTENQILVYPNPTTDKVFILLDSRLDPSNISYQLFDVLGRTMMNKGILKHTTTALDLNDIASGIYYLRFTQQNKQIVKKIIKP